MKTNLYFQKKHVLRTSAAIFLLALSVKSEKTIAQALTGDPGNKRHDASQSSDMASFSKTQAPLSFIENVGQVSDQNHQARTDIQFKVAASPGLNIFIGNGAIHYQFCKNDNPGSTGIEPDKSPIEKRKAAFDGNISFSMYRMDVELVGANKNAQLITDGKLGYFENHMIPGKQNHGATAHAWNRITYKDVYPDIDWVLYMHNGKLEHEFVIRKGGKVNDIQLKYGGAKGLTINEDGSITAITPQGTITEQAPASYQPDGKLIKSSFKLNGEILSYMAGNYSGGLVIDPTIGWATYYGVTDSSSVAQVNGVATDAYDHVDIVGTVGDFIDIATTGAHQTSYIGGHNGSDAFVAQFNKSGTLQWGTFYGRGGTAGFAITTDHAGYIYVTGATNDTGLATSGAYQTINAGGPDAFVAKFSSSGSLTWATYYGGSGAEDGFGIAVDSEGIYITGTTSSTSGIATSGAENQYFYELFGGASDIFLAKFNNDTSDGYTSLYSISGGGTILRWGTYMGGGYIDCGTSLALDSAGNVYVTGATECSGRIATYSAFRNYIYYSAQYSSGGNADAFLAKFNSGGSEIWGTYYGCGNDFSMGVATDNEGYVYMTGFTTDTSDIATSGAYISHISSGAYSYLVKFAASNGSRAWGTYYGGGYDQATSIAIDRTGFIYVAGNTGASSGVATSDAYQGTLGGSVGVYGCVGCANPGPTWRHTSDGDWEPIDAFLSEFNSAGSYIYGTYLGGPENESAFGVAVDDSGNVYIGGGTNDTVDIATSGAYQTVYGRGGCNNFLAEFNCTAPSVAAISGATTVCIGSRITLSDATTVGVWSASNGHATVNSAGFVTGVSSGTDTIIYTVTNACYISAVTYTVSVNHTAPSLSVTKVNELCHAGSTASLSVAPTGGATPYSYAWNTGASTYNISSLSAGNYSVTVTDNNGCTAVSYDTITQPTVLAFNPTINNGCSGSNSAAIYPNVYGGTSPYSYTWSNGATTEYINSLSSGSYSVTVTDSNSCTASNTFTVTASTPMSTAGTSVGGTSCTESFGTIFLSISGGTPFSYYTSSGSMYEVSWNNGAIDYYLNDLPVGVYTATITDANGCIDTASFSVNSGYTISLADTLANPSACTGVDGSIAIGASGGSTPYLYYWNNGSTGTGLSALPAGNYSVTVTDNEGCTAKASYMLSGPDTITIAGTSSRSSYCTGSDGGVVITIGGSGVTPYTYQWSNGTTTQNLSGVPGGAYSVTVTDSNGCTGAASFTVGQPDSTIITSTVSNESACGSNDGSISLSMYTWEFAYGYEVYWGGGVTYSWSNGATTADLSSLAPGVYSVIVTDPYGCTGTASYNIATPNPDEVIIGASSSNISTCGASDGSISLSVFGDYSPFTYSWSNGSTASALSALSAGNYSVTVTDNNGCTASAGPYTINPPDAISISGAITNTSYCGSTDGGITLTIGGSGITPYSYYWSNGATTANLSAISSGNYSVTVTDANGCSNTASFVVNGPDIILVSGTATNMSTCTSDDGSINLTIGGTGYGAYSFSWSDGETDQNPSGLSTGFYSVTVTDFYGCTGAASFAINGPDTITITGVTSVPTTCTSNDGSIALAISGSGYTPYAYSWSDGETSSTASPLAPGIYSVTVTDNNGCINTASYAVGQADAITIAGTSTYDCLYSWGSIILTIGGSGDAPYTYNWSNGSTDEDPPYLYIGTYSVTVTDANGCTDTASFSVNYPTISFLISAVNNISTCGGSDGSIATTISGGTPPYTYSWYAQEGGYGPVFYPASTTDSASGLSIAGWYDVGSYDANGCYSDAGTWLTQPDPISIGGTVTNPSACGSSDGSIALSVTGDVTPDTYSWSNGTTAENASALAAGTYSVSVTDNNGCFSGTIFTLNQPDIITFDGDPYSPSCYGGNNGVIDLTVGGGIAPYTFSWSNGETSDTALSLAAGTYSVTITDAHGCNNSTYFYVYQPSPIYFGATVTDVSAFGESNGSINGASLGGLNYPWTYSWSNGVSGTSSDWEWDLTGLVAGTYSLTFTDAHGCTADYSYLVTQPGGVGVGGGDTFYVSGNHIYDPCGDQFVPRGVNYGVLDDWSFPGDLFSGGEASSQIASTHANCARISWWRNYDGGGTGRPAYHVADLDSVISRFDRDGIVSIVSLHDQTGGNDSTLFMDSIVSWWTSDSVVALINKHRKSMIVNIANEWGLATDAGDSAAYMPVYIRTYETAITTMRSAGIHVPLQIDGPDYAGNTAEIAQVGGALESADGLHNVIMSFHDYQPTTSSCVSYDTAALRTSIYQADTVAFPVMLGETGNRAVECVYPYSDCYNYVNTKQILADCQQYNLGWLYWEWTDDGCGVREMSGDGAYSDLTSIGDTVVNDTAFGLAYKSVTNYFMSHGQSCTGISPVSGVLAVCIGSSTTLSDITTGGTWNSGSTSIATVGSGTGVVTGVGAGTVIISYAVSGSLNTAVVRVYSVTPAISGTPNVCVSSSTTLSDAGGGTWSSDNTSIATVGSGTGVVTGVSAGTTSITYSLGTGCIATVTVTVGVSSAGSVTGASGVCQAATTTLSDATGGGLWSSGNASVATVGSSTGVVTGVSAGSAIISYSVTGSCGTVAAIKMVTVTPLPDAGSITGSSSVNVSSTITLSDAAGGGTWSSSNTSIATAGSTTGVITGVAAGSAIISYSVTNSCGTARTTKTITVNSTTGAGVISGTLSVCTSATSTLGETVSGGTWSSSHTAAATIGSLTGIVTGVAAGTSIITYSVSGYRATAVVTVKASPAAVSGTATALCTGLSYTYTDATTGGTWSSSNTSVATVTSGTVTCVSAGATMISYTISDGCASAKSLTVNPTPDAITGSGNVCSGTSYTLTDDSTGGVWISSSTMVATVGSSTGIVSGVSAGTTTISYTLPRGCMAKLVITDLASPVAITGATPLCAGVSYTYTDATAGGTWSSSNTLVATVGTAGSVSGVGAGTALISYTISNGCMRSKTFTVNPTPDAISGVSGVCRLASYTFTDDPSGGVWKSASTAIATVGSTTGIVTGVSTGTTTISYTLPGGCMSTVVITGLALPAAITGTTPICTGVSYTYTDATTGGTWSTGDVSVGTVSAAGSVTGISTGSAKITYTIANGCTISKSFTVNPTPDAITGASGICKLASYTFTDDSTGGGCGKSSATTVATVGSATGIVTGVSTGTTTISYTLPGGCMTTLVITGLALPAAITGTTPLCNGVSYTYTDATTGGTWSTSDVSVGTVSSAGSVTGIGAGTAMVTYTITDGCSISKSFTVNPTPDAITGASGICKLASYTFTDDSTGGLWKSSATTVATVGSATGIVTGVSTGTTIISYTLPTGCMSTVVVTGLALPAAITGTTPICTGVSYAYTDATTGGTWSTSDVSVGTVSSAGSVTGISVGTAKITYTIANSCSISKSFTVNPTPDAITGASGICKLATYTFTDDSTGGVWKSSATTVATVGSATGIVTGVSTGTTTISYTLPTGCMSTVVVTGLALPAAITGTTPICTGVSYTYTDATTGGTWSTSDVSVGTVSSAGSVTGVGAGTAMVTYTIADGCNVRKSFTVNSSPDAITGVSGICKLATYTFTDDSTGGVWKSSATTVATVGSATGIVTGVSTGTTTISYTLPDGCMSKLVVTGLALPAAITGATPICTGISYTYTDATTGGTWSTSDESVGTVSTVGSVTGVGAGTAMVTYTITDGCRITKTFTVNTSPDAISGPGSLVVGASSTYMDDPTGGLWSSNHTTIATVGSATGIVHGVAAGTATITYSVSGCIATTTITITTSGGRNSSIDSTSGAVNISIIPNPNKGVFIVKGSLGLTNDETVTLQITDLLGQVVYNDNFIATDGNVNEQIQLSNSLANGMYILNIRTEQGNFVFHFVVEQ